MMTGVGSHPAFNSHACAILSAGRGNLKIGNERTTKNRTLGKVTALSRLVHTFNCVPWLTARRVQMLIRSFCRQI